MKTIALSMVDVDGKSHYASYVMYPQDMEHLRDEAAVTVEVSTRMSDNSMVRTAIKIQRDLLPEMLRNMGIIK